MNEAKHLKVTYGEQVLYDGPIEGRFTWSESPTTLSITVDQPKPSLLQSLNAASKPRARMRSLPTVTDGEPDTTETGTGEP